VNPWLTFYAINDKTTSLAAADVANGRGLTKDHVLPLKARRGATWFDGA